MKQRFTSREVVLLTGITFRQLQWWDERGIVMPVHDGRCRSYSLEDLAEIAVICELKCRGFSLQRIRKVMAFLDKEFGTRLVETVTTGSDYHLLTDGTHIYLKTSPEQIVEILKNSRQPIFAVCLSDAVRKVQAVALQNVAGRASPSVISGGRSRRGLTSVQTSEKSRQLGEKHSVQSAEVPSSFLGKAR